MSTIELQDRVKLCLARQLETINSLMNQHSILLSELQWQAGNDEERHTELLRIARWAISKLIDIELDQSTKSDLKNYIRTLNKIESDK